MLKVLLVEDDPAIAQVIQFHLEQEGEYAVVLASDAAQALSASRDSFDCILLDLMLPDVDGIALCESLRKYHGCPILFISCVEDDAMVIKALEKGGDDYLIKPFNMNVLKARIAANIRRVKMEHAAPVENRLSCAGFSLDVPTQTLLKKRKTYRLGKMEFRILLFFVMHPNRHFSASALYQEIWGKPSYGDVRTVQVHIHNLRQKIEDTPSSPRYLRSDWGKGYLFDPEGGR